jgi:telomerase reverse transcriptase
MWALKEPKDITEFVSSRRYETTTLHSICQNLKFLEFEWSLAPLHSDKVTQRSLSDAKKGRELVEEFLYWYFDSFLVPLLKVSLSKYARYLGLTGNHQTTFYCTESAAFRNQVLFFRQDDWKHLCQPLLDRLCSTTFDRLPHVGSSIPLPT